MQQNEFVLVMNKIFTFFQIPMNIYGFEVTMWQVVLYSMLASMLVRFIVVLISGSDGNEAASTFGYEPSGKGGIKRW